MKSMVATARSGSLLAFTLLMATAVFATPKVCEPAPAFKMQDQNGEWH